MNLQNEQIHSLAFNQHFKVKLLFEALKDLDNVVFNINICNTLGEPIVYVAENKDGKYVSKKIEKGFLEIEIGFGIKLLPNNYKFAIGVCHSGSGKTIDWLEGIYPFKVNKISYNEEMDYPWDLSHGYIELETNWSFKRI